MKRKNAFSAVRIGAALLVMLLVLLPAAAASQGLLSAKAAGSPKFSITVDTTAAYTGDTVTVTFYVNNDTDVNLTSFSGEISYNGDLFTYLGCEVIKSMEDSTGHQTVTPVETFLTANTVKFTFSDSTDSVLVSNGTDTPFLMLRLKMSGKNGSGSITGRINECYSGTVSYGQLAITQKIVTVITTTVPAQTTTAAPTPTTAVRSSDVRLSSLTVAPGTMSPSFNPEFVAYTVNVENEIANIRISATANSNEATVSGAGVRDLAVGTNNFTVTVTAGDGSTRQYGVIVYRADTQSQTLSAVNEGFTSSSDVTTATTTTTTMPTTMATAAPAETIVSLSDLDSSGSLSLEGDLLKVIGIVFGEIALFFFGFLSGFFIDKNIKTKAAAEKRLDELTRQRGVAYPEYDEAYPNGSFVEGSEYAEGYEEYPEGYAQYSEFDEYGNYIGYPQGDVSGTTSPDEPDGQGEYYNYK